MHNRDELAEEIRRPKERLRGEIYLYSHLILAWKVNLKVIVP